ncbi:MAG: hypothetical protein JXX28_06045 [Deltaproteobacteria bacterium]|nr:hypothetical protein [Deltaproteobacteria bacterium]
MRRVAVTGVGMATALGRDPWEVLALLLQGRSGVVRPTDERALLPIPGVAEAEVDVRPLLKRRKDKKLLPRAAELAIVAAADALGDDRPEDIGILLGVGREPTDGGASERAILSSLDGDGVFSPALFGAVGLPLYPPLASLRTLPNLILAHVAIQLDLTGEGGTRAGAEAAGLAAVVEGWHAVAEGRAEVVLAGGADSFVDPALARDRVRQGFSGQAPGEAAGFVRLEPLDRARARGAEVLAVLDGGGTRFAPEERWRSEWEGQLGACGAAAGVVDWILDLAGVSSSGRAWSAEDTGALAYVTWSRARV